MHRNLHYAILIDILRLTDHLTRWLPMPSYTCCLSPCFLIISKRLVSFSNVNICLAIPSSTKQLMHFESEICHFFTTTCLSVFSFRTVDCQAVRCRHLTVLASKCGGCISTLMTRQAQHIMLLAVFAKKNRANGRTNYTHIHSTTVMLSFVLYVRNMSRSAQVYFPFDLRQPLTQSPCSCGIELHNVTQCND